MILRTSPVSQVILLLWKIHRGCHSSALQISVGSLIIISNMSGMVLKNTYQLVARFTRKVVISSLTRVTVGHQTAPTRHSNQLDITYFSPFKHLQASVLGP